MLNDSFKGILLVGLVVGLFSCNDEEGQGNVPTPQGGSPVISEINFTSNTSAEINLENSISSFQLKFTDEFGSSTEFSGLSGKSVNIQNIPKGRIYQVQGSSSTGSYGDLSESKLASALPSTDDNMRKDMLKAINNARSEARLCGSDMMPAASPLAWDDKLELAAQVHTEDMHDNGFFAHNSATNGSKPGERISDQGYSWRRYGENIYRGRTTVEAAMSAWLQSEPHCKNIMSENVEDVGVARKGTYWTQVFAK